MYPACNISPARNPLLRTTHARIDHSATMMKKNRERMLFIATACLMSLYLLWRLFFTLPLGEGWFALLMGVLLLWAEIESALGTFELFWRRGKVTTLELPEIPEAWYPDVDVFVATHNEPVELLYKTLNACTFMEYPDKHKVHIYLCDDGNRPEMETLANSLGVRWLGLAGNKHAKSGNLNNALAQTTSPLVVTFDADMIPRSTFLLRSVPYFFLPKMKKKKGRWVPRRPKEIDKHAKVGFVQTPQSFYNPDLFQHNLFSERAIPNEQDFFTKEINVSRNSSNAAAYTGSNTVLARAALEEIGGFPTDTITEDFETGILIQSLGYTTYATKEVLASGLTPTSIRSMLTQRIRWARGVIQSIKNTRLPFRKGLSVPARISYMLSLSYWWSFARRLIFILAPILFALFGLRIAKVGFWDILLFWAPSHLFYNLSMRLLDSELRNQRWAQVVDTIMMPYMIIPVLLECLGIKQKKFKVTKKTAHSEEERCFRYAIPHLVLIGMSVAGIIKFTYGKYGLALVYSSIIAFWLIRNLINLLYAVFFMMGRPQYRRTERFIAREQLRVTYAGRELYTITTDVSEAGLNFVLDRPEYIPPDTPVSFTVSAGRYRASFQGVIERVYQQGGLWHYGARITAMDDANRRQYMQVVYDRMHSLPIKMDPWITAADDLLMNLSHHAKKQESGKSTLPHIALSAPVSTDDGFCGTLIAFDYRHALLAEVSHVLPFGRQVLSLDGGMTMVLINPEAVQTEGTGTCLRFTVENWQDLIYSPVFAELLDIWIAQAEGGSETPRVKHREAKEDADEGKGRCA